MTLIVWYNRVLIGHNKYAYNLQILSRETINMELQTKYFDVRNYFHRWMVHLISVDLSIIRISFSKCGNSWFQLHLILLGS